MDITAKDLEILIKVILQKEGIHNQPLDLRGIKIIAVRLSYHLNGNKDD